MSTTDASTNVPGTARLLGYAGLIPFIAASAGVWGLGGEAREASLALLLGYAAIILSFMGAVHWGLALAPANHARATRMMVLSVVPALIAWAALAMAPATALAVISVAFIALAAIDRRYSAEGIAPAWYWRLRLPLSVIVVVCLLAALAAIGV